MKLSFYILYATTLIPFPVSNTFKVSLCPCLCWYDSLRQDYEDTQITQNSWRHGGHLSIWPFRTGINYSAFSWFLSHLNILRIPQHWLGRLWNFGPYVFFLGDSNNLPLHLSILPDCRGCENCQVLGPVPPDNTALIADCWSRWHPEWKNLTWQHECEHNGFDKQATAPTGYYTVAPG